MAIWFACFYMACPQTLTLPVLFLDRGHSSGTTMSGLLAPEDGVVVVYGPCLLEPWNVNG